VRKVAAGTLAIGPAVACFLRVVGVVVSHLSIRFMRGRMNTFLYNWTNMRVCAKIWVDLGGDGVISVCEERN
jgi:hypothetical protein